MICEILTRSELKMHNNTESKLVFLKKYVNKSESFDEPFKKEVTDTTTASEIYILFLAHKKISAFLELIKLGTVVTASDMNEPRTLDNTNAWFHTLNLDAKDGNKILYQLLSQHIHPNAEALELGEKYTGISTWHKLLIHENYVGFLITLLKNNICPNEEITSSFQYYDEKMKIHNKISIWNILAHSKKLALLFIPFMEAGIYPSTNQLEECFTKDNTNTFYWLIKNKHFHILNELILKGYKPSSAGLNACRTLDNTNSWYWMAKRIAQDPELQKKIIEKIIPCPFMTLFSNGIYPSLYALNQLDKKYNKNVWHWLEQAPALKPALSILIQLPIKTEEPSKNYPSPFFTQHIEKKDVLSSSTVEHTM